MRLNLPYRLFLLMLAILAGPGGAAGATEPGFDADAALALSQAAIGGVVGDHRLVDRAGRAVRLGDYRGRPLVISLIYTSCYHTCPMTTRHLARAVAKARDALGTDSFRVVSIGFDTPNDTPAAMADFARRQGVADAPGWDFLSGDAATLRTLERELGFTYRPSPKGFDHLIQATVVDAQGRVVSQVYGQSVEITHLVEPLKRLVFGGDVPAQGALDHMWNRVQLFCVTYDPASDSYRFDYSLFIGMVIGGLIIAAGFAFLARELRRSRRHA